MARKTRLSGVLFSHRFPRIPGKWWDFGGIIFAGLSPASGVKFATSAPVAQLVEQLTCNEKVQGSIPCGGTRVKNSERILIRN